MAAQILWPTHLFVLLRKTRCLSGRDHMTQLTSILASVGDPGTNRENDVSVVQGVLDSKGFKAGAVNGNCTTQTIDAIRKFQATFMKSPDGLIEPNRTTWRKLSSTTTIPADSNLLEWAG